MKHSKQCKGFCLGLSNHLLGIFFTPSKFPGDFKSEELKSFGSRKQRTLHSAYRYDTRVINLVQVLKTREQERRLGAF